MLMCAKLFAQTVMVIVLLEYINLLISIRLCSNVSVQIFVILFSYYLGGYATGRW